jgi:hypothetical protein
MTFASESGVGAWGVDEAAHPTSVQRQRARANLRRCSRSMTGSHEAKGERAVYRKIGRIRLAAVP